jgi:hypothetical protein
MPPRQAGQAGQFGQVWAKPGPGIQNKFTTSERKRFKNATLAGLKFIGEGHDLIWDAVPDSGCGN